MSDTFLQNLMRIAHDETKAERAFAVNEDMAVVGMLNITAEQIEAPYIKCIRKAVSEGSPIITDNYTMTMEPSRAPVTNQSFPKLRFVVVIPVQSYGAICMDQSLRSGVTSKDKVDRLNRFIQQVINQQQTELEEEELLKLYRQM